MTSIITEKGLEEFIQDQKKILKKYGIDEGYFDRAFRNSELYSILMKHVIILKEEKAKKIEEKKAMNAAKVTEKDVELIKYLRKERCVGLQKIGDMFGISHERVRQLCLK